MQKQVNQHRQKNLVSEAVVVQIGIGIAHFDLVQVKKLKDRHQMRNIASQQVHSRKPTILDGQSSKDHHRNSIPTNLK